MSLRRYQKSLNRQQEMLLPSRVEDYVSDKNTVRAIDTYVDTLNLQSIGYTHTQELTVAGQPAYDPAGLLKLHLYGYMQGIRSSRKLEREVYRNLEVIWLIEGQRPSYKTIANFRKNNSKALKASNRDFVLLCKELNPRIHIINATPLKRLDGIVSVDQNLKLKEVLNEYVQPSNPRGKIPYLLDAKTKYFYRQNC